MVIIVFALWFLISEKHEHPANGAVFKQKICWMESDSFFYIVQAQDEFPDNLFSFLERLLGHTSRAPEIFRITLLNVFYLLKPSLQMEEIQCKIFQQYL